MRSEIPADQNYPRVTKKDTLRSWVSEVVPSWSLRRCVWGKGTCACFPGWAKLKRHVLPQSTPFCLGIFLHSLPNWAEDWPPLQVSHLPPDPSSGQKWSLHQAEVMEARNISNSAGNHGGHSQGYVPHISLRHSWDFREDVSWGVILPLQAVLSLVSHFAFPSPFQSQDSLCLPWPEQEDSANPVWYNQLQQSYIHSLFTLKMPYEHRGETHGLRVWVIWWWLSLGVT